MTPMGPDSRIEHRGLTSLRLPSGPGLLMWVVLVLALLLFLRYQIRLLSVQEFGDESETVLTARMMAAGMRLYAEIFNHHGPLVFYPGWLIELFGAAPIAVHRLPVAALQWGLLLALWSSPLLRRSALREVYVALAAAFMVLYLPALYGHMAMYQNVAGLMAAIALAVLVLPAACLAERPAQWRIVLGALLLAGLPFLAFTLIPSMALLVLAALRRDIARPLLIWFLVGLLLQVLMLACLGSLRGYAVFHFYMNLAILPEYVGVGPLNAFSAALDALSSQRHGALMLLLVASSLAFVAWRSPARFGWRAVAVGVAMGGFLIRGDNYQGAPFWYALLTLPLAAAAVVRALDWRLVPLCLAVLGVMLIRLSLVLPEDRARLQKPTPYGSEFARMAKLLTEPADRILAYSFAPFLYLDAERLPASGNFFYTPWQAKYAQDPQLGIQIDTCADIERHKPKLIRADRGAFWDRYPWESYAGCIDAHLERDYLQLPNTFYYVRNDLDLAPIGMQRPPRKARLLPSAVIASNQSLPIVFDPTLLLPAEAAIVGLELRFATYLRALEGIASLRIKTPGGEEHAVPVLLSDVRDNDYLSVDLARLSLKPDAVQSAVLIVGETVGFSLWDLESEQGRATCVALRLADESLRLTPGCPLP